MTWWQWLDLNKMTQKPGISLRRYQLRDYYLRLACIIADVSPQEVMSRQQGNRKVVATRRAVVWMLYTDGGLTLASVAAMMGINPGTAYMAVKAVGDSLRWPKYNPIQAELIKKLQEIIDN